LGGGGGDRTAERGPYKIKWATRGTMHFPEKAIGLACKVGAGWRRYFQARVVSWRWAAEDKGGTVQIGLGDLF